MSATASGTGHRIRGSTTIARQRAGAIGSRIPSSLLISAWEERHEHAPADKMPPLIVPAIYWILIGLWSFILYFYIKKMRHQTRSLLLTLLVILAIDAFRTLIESIYFGTWYAAVAGLLPHSVEALLTRPYLLVIPKLVNVAAACIVIFLLLKRWLPQDESERHQSKLDLLESEHRFREFTRQSSDGIGVADLDGHYSYVNPTFCKMVGYSEDELLNMTVFDLEADGRDPAVFERSSSSDVGVPFLTRLKRKDGSEFLAEIVGNLIEYGDQKNVLGVVRDVTARETAAKERLSLEQQLQHAQKLKSLGVLAGGIAHDFNNILTSVLGNAQLARDALPDGSSALENIEEIESSSRRAAELTRQMLDYSGKGRFVVQKIDPQKLVEGIARLLSVSISKKIELKHDFAEGTPRFDGDPTQVHQIVMNLVTNASEAIGDERGTITLSTGAMHCSSDYLLQSNATLRASMAEPLLSGRYTFIEVADTGCGMDAETLDKIFDPFFTTKFTGRGLGMSAVLGILRGHRGALHVDSTPGAGTTFRVLFPVGEESAASGQPEDRGRDRKNRWRGQGKVLVVDDEAIVLEVARRMVAGLGLEVLTAVDGEEALGVYDEHREEIACVLLDLTMPRMDGAEAYRELRRRDPDALIVLCSGYSEHEVSKRFVGLDGATFLHKPYDLASLTRVLEQALGKASPAGDS